MVTQPNGQELRPGERHSSPGILGNGHIWTGLWTDGRVFFKPDGPGAVHPDGTLEMKFWWYGSRARIGDLTITFLSPSHMRPRLLVKGLRQIRTRRI